MGERKRTALGLLCLLVAAGAACAAPIVSEKVENGVKSVILENEFIRVAMVPSKGGTGYAFFYKTANASLVFSPKSEVQSLLQDRVTQRAGMNDFNTASFAYRIVKNAETEGVVELWSRGATGDLFWVTLRKTLTVRAGDSALRVEYRYENQPESMTDLSYGFMVRNLMGVAGRTNTYYVPTTTGITTYVLDNKTDDEPFNYAASRGWMAFRSETGVGCAVRIPYAPLMCLYNYFGAGIGTVEWMTRKLPITAGQALESSIAYLPFRGLPAVDAATEDLVAGFDLPKEVAAGGRIEGALGLNASRAKEVEATVLARRLPDGEAKLIGVVKVALRPDEAKSIPVVFAPEGEGTWVVVAEIVAHGQKVARVERPVIVGRASGVYAMEPEAKRLGNDAERFLQAPTATAAAAAKTPVTISEAVVTPHTVWAKPYYRGKPKVLFIIGVRQTREVVELAQRADMDYDVATLSAALWYGSWELSKQNWGEADSFTDVERRLTGPDHYDAVVLTNPGWILDANKLLTPAAQKALLARVQQGCGLIVMSRLELASLVKNQSPLAEALPLKQPAGAALACSTWQPLQPHFISVGFPYEAMSKTQPTRWSDAAALPVERKLVCSLAGDPVVTVGECGKGRVVMLTWSPANHFGTFLLPWVGTGVNSPVTDALTDNGPRGEYYVPFRYADYYLSLFAKAMYWAAGRESELEISSFRPAAKVFERAAWDQAVIELAVQSRMTQRADLMAVMGFYDGFDHLLSTERQNFRAEPGQAVTLRFPAPAASPGGQNFAQLRIMRGNEAVNWGAISFQVAQPALIERIQLPPPPLPLALIRGEVALKGKVQGELRLALRDSNGRIFDRRRLPVAGAESVPFAMDLSRIPTLVAYLDAELYVDGRRADRVSRRSIVAKPDSPRNWWNVLDCYTWYRNFYAPAWSEQVKSLGFNKVMEPGSWEAPADGDMEVEGGLDLLSRTGYYYYSSDARKAQYAKQKQMYQQTGDKQYLVRVPCFNDPEYRKRAGEIIRKAAENQALLGAHNYCLGDEVSTTDYNDPFDFCYCPHCLTAFRLWLKGEYADLAALNAKWGTALTTWDEVVPLTFDESQKAGRYASWADHKRFMEVSFNDFALFCRDTIRAADPRGRLSLSGTQDPGPWGGQDIWLRVNTFEFLSAYGSGMQHPALQYTLNPRIQMTRWVGYQNSYDHGGFMESVLDGLSGVCFWHEPIFIGGDLVPSPSAVRLSKYLKPWSEGLMSLLFDAQWETRGAAILYSQSSIRASAFANRGSRTMGDWATVLGMVGVDYQFISYAQLAAGELQKRGFGVLVLPESVALSTQECSQIRAFAEAGGLVIADSRPALFDEHCAPAEPPALDRLFGITTGKTPDTFRGAGTALVVNPPNEFKSIAGGALHVMPLDSDLAATDALPLGSDSGAQAVFYRRFGKGAAVLLNLPVSQYVNLANGPGGRERGWTTLLMALFGQVNALPAIRINEPGTDLPANGLKTRRWTQGPVTYVGMNLAAKPRELVLPEERYVYDILDGKALGRGAKFVLPAPTTCVKVFAVMPYEVKAVALDMPNRALQGSDLKVSLSVKTGGGAATDHVLHLSLRDPSGREVPWSAANISAPGGHGVALFRFALNDATGRWTVMARDVATGVAAEKPFDVVEFSTTP